MVNFIKHSESYLQYRWGRRAAMTLMEILIVISLVAMLSIALYHSVSQGIRIWEKSQRLVIEEDVVLFFDKLSQDLRNSFSYSSIPFEGHQFRLSFPALVQVSVEKPGRYDKKDYKEQIGKVEYSFDPNKDCVIKKQAGYGQALSEEFSLSQEVLKSVQMVQFRYVYLTAEGEYLSPDVLEVIPASVEVTVEFSDQLGKRELHKLIDIPVGS